MSRKTRPDKRSGVKKSGARHRVRPLLGTFERRPKIVACVIVVSLIVGVTYARWLPSETPEDAATETTAVAKNEFPNPVRNVSTLSATELADIPLEAFRPRPRQAHGYNASQGGFPPGALPPGVVLPGITQPLTPSPQGYGGYDGVRQQFTGKERDSETGLDYFGARYYSAVQGRFTSVDPENASANPSDPQSWNGYAYARNNPLAIIDKDGREFQWVNANGEIHYLTDRDFERAKKDLQAQGFIFSNGKIYIDADDGNGGTVRTQTGTYMRTDTSAMWDKVAPQLSARLEPVQKVVTVAAIVSGAVIAFPIAGLELAGSGGAALNLATKTEPAAGAGGTVLSQLSRTDATIFQRATQLGASAQNSFMNNVAILRNALFQVAGPDKQINIIGKVGNSPVYGSIRSRVGIAEVNGVTVVVKMSHGTPKVLGPLP